MTRWMLGALLIAAALAHLLVPWSSLVELWRTSPDTAWLLLSELRLPRTLLALGYGAVLGMTGAALQALFANPLASPDITGASSGAALGAVLGSYWLGFTGPFALACSGAVGALAALAIVVTLAGRRSDPAVLLLAGVAVSLAAGAATSLLLALAPSPFAFYDSFEWLMGSFVDRSLPQAAVALLVLPLLLTGCSVLSSNPPATTYDLGPLAAAPAQPPAPLPKMRVAQTEGPDWMDGSQLYYRLQYSQPQRLQAYSTQRWVQPAPRLFDDRLREAVSARGALGWIRDASAPGMRVDLLAFEQVFDTATSSRGVVRARVGDEIDLKRALNVLADVALPARDVELGAAGASFLVPTALTPDWSAIELRMKTDVPSLVLESGLGAASVVGDLPERALTDALELVAGTRGASASGGRVSLLVPENDLDGAVRALHEKFVR